MLQGKKTYIVAILTAALTIVYSLGYINEEVYKALLALLGASGLAAVGAKINRIENKVR
jgi:hypothetical protein